MDILPRKLDNYGHYVLVDFHEMSPENSPITCKGDSANGVSKKFENRFGIANVVLAAWRCVISIQPE